MTANVEDAIAALHGQIKTALATAVPGALVLDEDPGLSDAPLPAAGLVAIYLDDRGIPTDAADGKAYWRETDARVELLVQHATATGRRTKLRALIDAVEAAIDADRSLGGVITDCDREAIDPGLIPVDGASDAASEVILVTLEYESLSRI